MRIAVLILFYEKPEQTVECLESVLPSGAPIHVLNNGSSDASSRIVAGFAARHPSITVWPSPRNLGVAAGRNFLLAHTTEPWLFFIDNDARVTTPGWISALDAHIAAHPDVEAFVPRTFNVHEASYFESRNVVLENDVVKERKRSEPEVNVFPGTSLIRRALFERLGTYDEAMFVGCEDFELALRGIKAGAPIRGLCIDDIELWHDHRRALTAGDRQATLDRYDHETIDRSFSYLLKKHGVRWSNDATGWSRMERRRMLGGPVTRFLWKVRYRVAKTLEACGVPFVARR